MTDAGWAWERAIKIWKGFRGGLIDYGTQLLEAEHARAIRVVKAQLKAAQMNQHRWLQHEKEGYVSACKDILQMLQRGRGGKG